jgi:hypothetical protein
MRIFIWHGHVADDERRDEHLGDTFDVDTGNTVVSFEIVALYRGRHRGEVASHWSQVPVAELLEYAIANAQANGKFVGRWNAQWGGQCHSRQTQGSNKKQRCLHFGRSTKGIALSPFSFSSTSHYGSTASLLIAAHWLPWLIGEIVSSLHGQRCIFAVPVLLLSKNY